MSIQGLPELPILVQVADEYELMPMFTNYGLVDNGVEMRLTGWSGWADTPDVRSSPVDVPGGDGVYDDAPLFGARTIVLKGVARAKRPQDLLMVERMFNRQLTRGTRYGEVTVTQGAGDWAETRRCQVRLNGSSTFDKTLPIRAEWSMSLFAADPLKYAVQPGTGFTTRYQPSAGRSYPRTFPVSYGGTGTTGTIDVNNAGDRPVGVLLEIAGACDNPQVVLVETGQRIALATSLVDGVVIDTNTRRRSILRNGAPFGYVLTSDSDLFLLPEGDSTLLFLADSGNPTLTATWFDATL